MWKLQQVFDHMYMYIALKTVATTNNFPLQILLPYIYTLSHLVNLRCVRIRASKGTLLKLYKLGNIYSYILQS